MVDPGFHPRSVNKHGKHVATGAVASLSEPLCRQECPQLAAFVTIPGFPAIRGSHATLQNANQTPIFV